MIFTEVGHLTHLHTLPTSTFTLPHLLKITLGYTLLLLLTSLLKTVLKPFTNVTPFVTVLTGFKVLVLLFCKMILLPLLLGIALNDSYNYFGPVHRRSVSHNNTKKESDDILLLLYVLYNWVLGISFMLTVTVSVLQLREVLHPKILGPIIRPQEPQPDLLGNLVKEEWAVHGKRMGISLGIYFLILGGVIYPSLVLPR